MPLARRLGRALAEDERERLLRAMPGLKPRAKTIVELAEKTLRDGIGSAPLAERYGG